MKFYSGLTLIACLTLVLGCGDAQHSHLTGKVTIDGTSLNSGSITFKGQENVVKTASIQSDGTYSIEGIPKGNAQITISVPKPPTPGPDGVILEEPGTYEPNPVLIPAIYENIEKSGLSVDVTGGDQTHDIALEKK